jgi:hypothetical protein
MLCRVVRTAWNALPAIVMQKNNACPGEEIELVLYVYRNKSIFNRSYSMVLRSVLRRSIAFRVVY